MHSYILISQFTKSIRPSAVSHKYKCCVLESKRDYPVIFKALGLRIYISIKYKELCMDAPSINALGPCFKFILELDTGQYTNHAHAQIILKSKTKTLHVITTPKHRR
jgi:hypothetical protein